MRNWWTARPPVPVDSEAGPPEVTPITRYRRILPQMPCQKRMESCSGDTLLRCRASRRTLPRTSRLTGAYDSA